jgi:hypothetical protein
VRLTVNGAAQTRDVEVRLDPRRDVSRADLMARQDALMELYALQKPMREAGQRLQAMNRRVADVREAMKEADLTEAEREALTEEVEAVAEELEAAGEAMGRASLAARAGGMENWSGAPTADQLWSIETTWTELPGVIEQINGLLTNRMPAFEARVIEAGLKPPAGTPVQVPRRP